MILTAAVVAISFATPQVSNAMKAQNQMAVVDDKDDKYKEIKVEELPEAVSKSITTAYTGYTIDKAFRGEDNSYKVKVAMGDLKYHLFYDAQGELIKVEDPSTSSKDDKSLNMSEDPTKKSMEPTKSETPANESETTPVR